MRILILDGDSNEGRAIVQSLGARGDELCLAATSTGASAFASRYVGSAASYPDPLVDKAAFQAWLIAFQEEQRFRLIIPPTERTLVPLHELRDVAALRGVVALPPAEALEVVLDKERLLRLAVSLGVPAPDSMLATRPEDLDDPRLDEWLRDTAVVVKGTRSKVWTGRVGRDLRVQLATSRAELERVVRPQLATVPMQLQRWVPGVGIGVELLARDGEIVLAFAHERLHELPLTGGGSSYRKAIVPPPSMLRDAGELLRALRWHGVLMVEFRAEPRSSRYWLMEINGRFWGSLPLAIFAGADFPAALAGMLLDGRAPQGPPPRTNVYARQLARDVGWLKAILKNRGGGRFLATRPLGRSLLEWGRVFTGVETWDGASLRDPGPILHELREVAAQEVGAAGRKAGRAVLLRWATLSTRRRLERLAGARRLLVLCYGNVCRSAYAAARLRGAPELASVEVRGAGLHPQGGRATPSRFAAAARARGVELAEHRSRVVERADLDWADAVVIMDQKNHDLLRALHPAAARRALWMGALAGDGGPEIEDPYDAAPAEVEAILERLDRAARRVARALTRSG